MDELMFSDDGTEGRDIATQARENNVRILIMNLDRVKMGYAIPRAKSMERCLC